MIVVPFWQDKWTNRNIRKAKKGRFLPYTWGGITKTGCRLTDWKTTWQKRVLVNNKLNVSQNFWLAARKTDSILGCLGTVSPAHQGR